MPEPIEPLVIPVSFDPSEVNTGELRTLKEKTMAGEIADLSPNVANQMLTQLVQSGTIAQNNFVTVQKAMDYDYLENKRMVTIDEAVGVWEVSSRESMAGKPTA